MIPRLLAELIVLDFPINVLLVPNHVQWIHCTVFLKHVQLKEFLGTDYQIIGHLEGIGLIQGIIDQCQIRLVNESDNLRIVRFTTPAGFR